MFSEVPKPGSGLDPTWVKKHYCQKKECQEQATFDKLTDNK